MYTFFIIYFVHALWAYLKGVNYTYPDFGTFIIHTLLGSIFTISLGHFLKVLLPKKRFFVPVLFVGSLLLVVFVRYRYRFGSSANLAVFFDNFELLFNSEGLKTASGKLKPKDYLIALIVATSASAITALKFKKLTNKLLGIFSFSVIFSFIHFYPIQNSETLSVSRTAYEYFFPRNFKGKDYSRYIETGPRKVRISPITNEKPNIFLILMESYSHSYIGEKTPAGKEITPTLNRLIRSQTYIPYYYSPTIQTVKAQYSILCSKIPLIKGKASYQLDKIKFNCAPKFLNELGYETFFYKSYQDMTFDNTDQFAKKIGFGHIEVAPLERLAPEEKKTTLWGWGPQDDISYKLFLDRSMELSHDKPVFSVMTTVSHHMNFNKIPDRLKYLFPHPKSKTENFQNSLHLSDLYLKTFLNEIKVRGLDENSLIFITADHSYPSGEHGNHNSELGAWEENFRIPMVILGPKHLLPKINPQIVYSHYDLLPTILSAAGYSGEVSSIGNSMYTKNQNFPTPLIQPYDGLKIRYPMGKTSYVWSASADKTNKIEINTNERVIETADGRKQVQNFLDFTFAELELSKN